MKLKEIHRTSTFAWSPEASLPLLATGTVAGALDESFSNESQLEIWAPNFLDKDEFDLGVDSNHGPKNYVTDTARYVLFFSSFLATCNSNALSDLIVSRGDASIQVGRAALLLLDLKTENWRCGILQKFLLAKGMFFCFTHSPD